MKKSKSKNKEVSKISVNMKRLKKEKGLTKSDLVRKTDLDYHTIAKIEDGRTSDPRINTLMKIAEALGKPIEELVS